MPVAAPEHSVIYSETAVSRWSSAVGDANATSLICMAEVNHQQIYGARTTQLYASVQVDKTKESLQELIRIGLYFDQPPTTEELDRFSLYVRSLPGNLKQPLRVPLVWSNLTDHLHWSSG